MIPLESLAKTVGCTHWDLEALIDDGEFREDLFYRLNVMPLYLPPLESEKSGLL